MCLLICLVMLCECSELLTCRSCLSGSQRILHKCTPAVGGHGCWLVDGQSFFLRPVFLSTECLWSGYLQACGKTFPVAVFAILSDH